MYYVFVKLIYKYLLVYLRERKNKFLVGLLRIKRCGLICFWESKLSIRKLLMGFNGGERRVRV